MLGIIPRILYYTIPIQDKCFAVECNMILYFHWVLIRLNVQQNENNTTINKKKIWVVILFQDQ